MKRCLLGILLILLNLFCYASDVRNIQDNYQLIYHIIDENGDPVSGQTVTLKIKRVSDGAWLDFNDDTFKTSGWTSKSTNLSEDTTEGYYYYTFDPPASETSAEEYLFLVDNSDSTYGDHQSLIVCYQDIGTSDFDYANNQVTVGTNNDKTGYSLSASGIDAIWDEAQSGHTTSGTFGYYLDSQISAISASISEADKNDIADRVWDEALADHQTVGSTGKKLDDLPLSGTADWTSVERTAIKNALSVDDGSADITLDTLGDYTDGDKESGSYSGIEKLIRRHR